MITKTVYPKGMHTRLIYPFFFKQDSVHKALDALLKLKHKGKKGDVAVWEPSSEVPELYQQEVFSAAQRFLFANEDSADCRFLKLSDNRANAWFRKRIDVLTPRKNADDFSVSLLPKTGVELFLSPHGVGILSIAFKINLPDEDSVEKIEDYKLYNYYLSQLRRKGTIPTFSLPESPVPMEESEKQKADNSIAARLGKSGKSFQLAELYDYLLDGLQGELGLRPIQQQFSVYTVAHFSHEVDFSAPEVRHDLGPFLSGLAQVEEVNHAGHIPGVDLDIINHVMNTRHWAAMSFLGAAHLVSDQGVEFDSQRLLIISHKYFIPYLAAYFQRLILQRLIDDASQCVHQKLSCEDETARFSNLHSELLNFNVTGLFTEISSRQALNRYYHMGQKAFAIDKNIERVNKAIHNFDANKVAKGLTDNAEGLAKNSIAMSENLKQISKVQGSVEWFQVLFIIGATAQLTEYIGAMSGNNLYGKLSMLLAPMITGVVSLIILRPWSNDPDFTKNKNSIITWGIILSIVFLLWWGGAYFVGKDSKEVACKNPKSTECTNWKAKQKSSFFDFLKFKTSDK